MIDPEQAHEAIVEATGPACAQINAFAKKVLNTRGGRIGSGMGALLEALWGYYVNNALRDSAGQARQCELAWMYAHEYNDFACIVRDQKWDPTTREGELLRLEAKSMVASADESKAHFDQIVQKLNQQDILVVLVWDWVPVDDVRVCPQILDHFVGPALPIAEFRDALHIARGGTFVTPGKCPDGCAAGSCSHVGEPLNEQGKRERRTGPESRRVSQQVSYASNFGGMVRMLKTNSDAARKIFRESRRRNDTVDAYVSFIHKNFPNEEMNQYSASEWKRLAGRYDIDGTGLSKDDLAKKVRETAPEYRTQLRDF